MGTKERTHLRHRTDRRRGRGRGSCRIRPQQTRASSDATGRPGRSACRTLGPRGRVELFLSQAGWSGTGTTGISCRSVARNTGVSPDRRGYAAECAGAGRRHAGRAAQENGCSGEQAGEFSGRGALQGAADNVSTDALYVEVFACGSPRPLCPAKDGPGYLSLPA